MKHIFKSALGTLLCLAMLISLSAGTAVFARDNAGYSSTILFTHDLHSHFLPVPDGDGGESGGYARLMTALENERKKHPDALTLDGGDFSIGSLIQTLYTSEATELRTLGALGYDAATIGNHEFDHTGQGFADMLNSAVASGDRLPYIVDCNYFPRSEGDEGYCEEDDYIRNAMDNYGVEDYVLIERGPITYGIFGVYGTEADEDAPTSGFVLEDAAVAAQKTINEIKAAAGDKPLFIIALSHSGTSEDPDKSEDELLAKNVEGIDLIISGHSHTTLETPIEINDTIIVSCGPYCQNLGSITVAWDSNNSKTITEYNLIPIDETLEDNAEIATMIEHYKERVGETYLSGYDMTYDEILASSDFDLTAPGTAQEENVLGNLIADSYIYAVKQAEGDNYTPVDLAVTASGIIRSSLHTGDITVSDAFDVLSMGVGNDGTSGFPLVSVYLTGKELKAVCEVDASVTPIMNPAQLYCSGIKYEFNKCRMFFNKVTDVRLVKDDGTLENIDDEKLYRVVTGMYSAQMLSTVKDKSMGLLSLVPKDASGNEITDFNSCIIYDSEGSEVKEWYALASYLKSFEGGRIPSQYETPDGRKLVTASLNPVELLKNANMITVITVIVIILLLALIIFIINRMVRLVKKRIRKK